MATLRVATSSNPGTVAGAIAGEIRKGNIVEVFAIGRDAVNQAVKAVAIARRYLEEEKTNIVCEPSMQRAIPESPESKTIMCFKVYKP